MPEYIAREASSSIPAAPIFSSREVTPGWMLSRGAGVDESELSCSDSSVTMMTFNPDCRQVDAAAQPAGPEPMTIISTEILLMKHDFFRTQIY